MRRTTLTLLAVGLLTATAACSSSTTDKPAAAGTAATQPAGAASPAQPADQAADASAVLAKLTAAVKTVKTGVQVTADNDPNHLLGRPGQYTSKVTFSDSRIKAADVEGEKEDSVNRGGAIEVFATEADAKARSEYIQGIVKGMPALMEYDYVHGPVLVRVSKLLTPDQAKALQAAI
ncbi:hypothetical protein ACIRVF_08415 [Kitasatospora sp. NPDC101157]|uniref:hypothetical protein n=1 Tax=Kitasatospora sp. NPDC101157 TaxID=3364098 RepID=UPI003817D89E